MGLVTSFSKKKMLNDHFRASGLFDGDQHTGDRLGLVRVGLQQKKCPAHEADRNYSREHGLDFN